MINNPLQTALRDLMTAYAACNGEDHPAYERAEKLLAGISASPPSPQEHVLAFPRELTDDLRDVLSTMLWTSGQIARCLRAGGVEIKTRAEDEQAHVLHWLIGLALEHGSEWRVKAQDRIREISDAQPSATEGSDNG